MDLIETVPLNQVECIFDPAAKTAVLIRFGQKIAVPGRFVCYEDAFTACFRVVRSDYADAYTHI